MNPEQQLIQQIIQEMASGPLENDARLQDLAIQFVELAQKANDRLVRCIDYLDKDMRSEAVHEARTLPDLLQVAALLEFDGVKKWRNLCADYELPSALVLSASHLDRLRAACDRELELEPMVKEYRRAVFQRDHDACITVLRQLRQEDPLNPNWESNLRPLEEASLDHWCDLAEASLVADDRQQQQEVYEELTNPQRAVPPPEPVLQKLRMALMREKAAELLQKGEKIGAQLRSALVVKDELEVKALLTKAETLAAEEAFLQEPNDWQELQAAGKDFLEQQEKYRASQADFLAAAEDMQQRLADSNATELDLRQTWERLLAHEQPVSEMLQRQVEERLQAMAQGRQRRARMVKLATVLLIIVVLAACGAAVYTIAHRRQLAAMQAEMEQMFKQGEYGALQEYLQQLRQTKPEFHQSPKVTDLRRQLDQELKNREVQQERFTKMQQEWDALRQSFEQSSPEKLQRFLEEANSVVRNLGRDAEQKVQSWQQSWQRWQDRRQLQANQELQRAASLITTAAQAASRQPFTKLEQEQQKLQELQDALVAAQPHYVVAGVEAKEQWDAARELLATWEREKQQRVEEMTAKQAELDRQRQQLLRSLPDLGRYRQQLSRLVEVDAEDAVSVGYRRCLEQFRVYEGAVALQGFRTDPWPLSTEAEAKLESLLSDGGGALRTIWESDLRRLQKIVENDHEVRQRLKGLLSENQEMLNLYVWRLRPIGGQWRPLYMPKELIARQERTEEDRAYTRYFGYVYFTEGEFGVPRQLHTSRAFPNHLTTLEYEVEKSFNAEENRCAYAKFLFRFALETDAASSAAEHILSGLMSLQENKSMEIVPKAWLMKRLANLLNEYYRALLPESASWAEALNQVGTDVPWMNPKNSDTIAAIGMFEEVMEQININRQSVRKLQANQQALLQVLNTELRCVGALRLDQQDGLKAYFAEQGTPSEVWVLLAQSAQSQPVFKILSAFGGALRADVLAECFPGLPLFAPAPGQELHGKVEKWRQMQSEMDFKLEKPASWPVNAWP